MKEILKKELEGYFKIVKERNEYVNAQIKDLKLFHEIEGVNNGICRNAIKFLKQTGYDFEKERFNGSQIYIEEDSILIREFKQRTKHKVYFTEFQNNHSSAVYEFMPKGFLQAVEKINDIEKEHKKRKDEFKTENENEYRRHYSFSERRKTITEKKLKGNFEIVNDYEDFGIENNNNVTITVSTDSDGKNVEVKLGDEQSLYYDEVYNAVIEAVELLKRRNEKAIKQRDKVQAEIDELLKEDNFKALMVAENL